MAERKVLIVDDERPISMMLEIAFKRKGYVVHTAQSGAEALAILDDEQIWVMFLDLNMPHMNGLQLCRKIKEKYPMAITHAVTGYGGLYELFDCREAGFEDYFLKPVDISVLYKAAEDSFARIDRWMQNMPTDSLVH